MREGGDYVDSRDLISFLGGLASFIAIVVSLVNIAWLIEGFPQLKWKVRKKRKRKTDSTDTEGNDGDHE